MIYIDWDEVQQKRSQKISWNQISKDLGISRNALTHRAKKKGIYDGTKFYTTKNKRICDFCRKFYNKSDISFNIKGQFCKECYKRKFPDSKRVQKWKEKNEK